MFARHFPTGQPQQLTPHRCRAAGPGFKRVVREAANTRGFQCLHRTGVTLIAEGIKPHQFTGQIKPDHLLQAVGRRNVALDRAGTDYIKVFEGIALAEQVITSAQDPAAIVGIGRRPGRLAVLRMTYFAQIAAFAAQLCLLQPHHRRRCSHVRLPPRCFSMCQV